MSKAKQESKDEKLDKDVVLHHIDKIYSTQTRIWESANRVLVIQMILSLIIIALSSGIIGVEEGVEISGINFKISLAVLLSGGALLVSGLYIAYASLTKHSDYFRDEIKNLYGSIGYEVPTRAEPEVDAFEVQSFLDSITNTSLRSKRFTKKLVTWYSTFIGYTILIGVAIVIPITAQITASLKVAALFGWRWWILTPFAVLIVLTVTTFVSAIFKETA